MVALALARVDAFCFVISAPLPVDAQLEVLVGLISPSEELMLNSESESPSVSALLLVRVEFLPVLGRRGLFLAVPVPIPAGVSCVDSDVRVVPAPAVSPAGMANESKLNGISTASRPSSCLLPLPSVRPMSAAGM